MGSAHRTAVADSGRRRIVARVVTFAVADAPRRIEALAWSACEPGAAGYPAALRDLSDAPARLWTTGRAVPAPGRTVAIVGSRAASGYGLARARALAADLARLEYTVVSGLARGIDAAAHEAALEAGGATVAVLPGPPGEITPRSHTALAHRIAGRGTLLTEVPPGESVSPSRFARRNRMIAALAAVTVVVEAAESSGALITAADAKRLGRVVMAVPGDVGRPTTRGTFALLCAGARPCAEAGDVLAALAAWPGAVPPSPRRRTPAAARPATLAPRLAPASPEAAVAEALAAHAETVEWLAARAGLDAAAALAALLTLEWAGVARREPGGRWRRAGARR